MNYGFEYRFGEGEAISTLWKMKLDPYYDDHSGYGMLSINDNIYRMVDIIDVIECIHNDNPKDFSAQRSMLIHTEKLANGSHFSWLEVVKLHIAGVTDEHIVEASDNDIDYHLLLSAV